jgi:hypothetical protein
VKISLVAFVVLVTATATVRAQETLTNETIVSMTKAHLSEKVILEMIQSNPGKYVVTSSALIALKQQGVSDDAIAAMRAKMSQTTNAPTSASRVPPNPPTSSQGWTFRPNIKDEITGASEFDAILPRVDADNRGSIFQVTATCAEDHLVFKVDYHSGFDPNLGYKLTDLRPKPEGSRSPGHRWACNQRRFQCSRLFEFSNFSICSKSAQPRGGHRRCARQGPCRGQRDGYLAGRRV